MQKHTSSHRRDPHEDLTPVYQTNIMPGATLPPPPSWFPQAARRHCVKNQTDHQRMTRVRPSFERSAHLPIVSFRPSSLVLRGPFYPALSLSPLSSPKRLLFSSFRNGLCSDHESVRALLWISQALASLATLLFCLRRIPSREKDSITKEEKKMGRFQAKCLADSETPATTLFQQYLSRVAVL